MKINSIKLKNIHSLKGVHQINFVEGPLAQTGLFAIIGPTGSGKSTLLDAITLALFNATPRSGSLSKAAIEKMGAVITRNTDEAFCEVDYESNGKTFRSRWEISRARTGNLRDYHMTIAVQDEKGDFGFLDLKKGDVPDKNAEIIGLNYDQFIKSILLSQGEFAKFLKSNAKDRSALLEKITGTEIYREIGKMAFEKQKTEKLLLDQLVEKLGDIKLLSSEDMDAFKTELLSFQNKIDQSKKQLINVDKKINIKKQLIEKTTLEEKLKKQFEALLVSRKEMNRDGERLVLHHKLLPHKSDIDRLSANEERMNSLNLQLENSIRQSALKSKDSLVLNDDLKTKNNNLENANKNHEALQPVIFEVKKLDQEINIEKSKKTQAEKLLLKNKNDLDEAMLLMKQQTENLNTINQNLLRIDKFMDENPRLEDLGEVLPGIIGQKTQLNSKAERLNQITKTDHAEIYHRFNKIKSQSEKLEFLQMEGRAVADDRKICLTEFDGVLPDQQQLLGNIEETTAAKQVLTEILRLSKTLKFYNEEKNNNELTRAETSKTYDNLAQKTETTSQAIGISEKRIEELRTRKEREALEAKYDQARIMLEAENPCPLCGSTQHPFVENYQNNLNKTTVELTSEKLQLEKLKNSFEKSNHEFNECKSKLLNFESNLKRLATGIAETQEEIKLQIKKSQRTLIDYEPETVKNTITNNEKNLKGLKDKMTLLQKISTLEIRLTAILGLIEKAEELAQIESEINLKLQAFPNYFDTKMEATDKISVLQNKLSRYKEAISKKALYRENAASTSSAIAEKEKQLTSIKNEKDQLLHDLGLLDENLKQLGKKRISLFGDKDPDKEDKLCVSQIQKLQKEISHLDKQIEILKEQIKNTEDQIKKMNVEVEDLKVESNHLQTKLSAILKPLEIQTYLDASKSLLNEQEAKHIQLKLDELKSAIDKTDQSIEDIKESINILNADDDKETPLELLQNSMQMFEQEISGCEREIGNHTARLQLDAENREKSAGIRRNIQKQEKEFSRWEALNKLIGDATGSKFSRFAQQLTLSQMLAGANHHLKKLSDRYIVINEIADDIDELFVIDTYYGDEKRSVKTLSGGESFLVSLALALGLSDLAASKTKISSLFIDEGFGSLDQQTLDTALSTLERLQHETNRTIGIISHVEALKERISTQIELSQDASGNSVLKINA